LNARPERRRWYREFTGGLREPSWPGLSVEDIEIRRNSILAAVSAQPSVKPMQRRDTSWRRIAAATVAVAFAGVIASGVYWGSSRQSPDVFREYAAATGQQAAIHLADGSDIILAPQSVLRVPADFGVSSRTVVLH